METGAGRRKGKKMTKEKEKDVLAALSALDAEAQAKILAALNRDALAAALAEKRGQERKDEEKRRKALAEKMATIGKILDASGISGVVIFERGADGAWVGRIGGRHGPRGPRGPRRNSVVLDGDMRNFLEKATFTRDPEKCKPSGACEVWIATSGNDARKIPASVLAFWAIWLVGKSEKKTSDLLASKGISLTGGQIRGAMLRYDAVLDQGLIKVD